MGYCSMKSAMAEPPSLLQQTALVSLGGVDATSSAAVGPDVAALERYGSIISAQPNCTSLHLSQTEFLGNVAIGGGGGAIFWNGPVDMLIVSCDSTDLVGKHARAFTSSAARNMLVYVREEGLSHVALLQSCHSHQPLRMAQRCPQAVLAGRATTPLSGSGMTWPAMLPPLPLLTQRALQCQARPAAKPCHL